ncbi:MAG: hypothetical protein LBB14_02445 [Puniceicoccales bacterium]|jgi:hypothetical protein|nr:hypothetical protein [Puniceicoccales bacterium]
MVNSFRVGAVRQVDLGRIAPNSTATGAVGQWAREDFKQRISTRPDEFTLAVLLAARAIGENKKSGSSPELAAKIDEPLRQALLANADKIGKPPPSTANERSERVDALLEYLASSDDIYDLFAGKLAQDVRTEIGRIPTDIYGHGSAVEDFLREQYSTTFSSSAGADRLIFEDFLDARTYAGKEPIDAKDLIGIRSDPNAINLDALRKSMFRFAVSDDFPLNLEKQQLFARLQNLSNPTGELRKALESIVGMSSKALPLSFENLSPFKGKSPPTTAELRILAIGVVLTEPIRQEPGVGSCFAASAAINLQCNKPEKLMELFAQMITKNCITATNENNTTVLVQFNCNEMTDQGYSPVEILQHAMVRTFADASTMTKRRMLDRTAVSFQEHIYNINDLMPATKYSTVTVSCDNSYDSAATTGIGGNVADEGRGAWLPHITLVVNSDKRVLPGGAAALEEIARIAKANKNELQADLGQLRKDLKKCKAESEKSEISQKISRIDEEITKAEALFVELNSLSGLYQAVGGGRSSMVMASLGIPFKYSATGSRTCRSGEEVFRYWGEYLLSGPKGTGMAGEPARILVAGKGHGYNLAPTFSDRIAVAMKRVRDHPFTNHDTGATINHPETNTPMLDPDFVRNELNSIVEEIKAGREIMLIDPNWQGYAGVGVKAVGTPPTLSLFLKCDDGSTILLDPGDDKNRCFFCDLSFYEDKTP